ncbi:hypothetical protein [Dongia sp. agr-C8]
MTTDSFDRTAASSDDPALIAEIAPPMLENLKRTGQLVGSLCAMIIVIAVSNFQLSEADKAAISSALHLGRGSIDRLGDFSFIFSLLGSFIVLPWYFEVRTVKHELSYRRQHGKWRWER